MATQPEKRENSVLFSLRELRQIEENRVAEEEHAVRSAEEQRVRAAQEAERKRREAEEAKIQAERQALLQIEQARENAEREARMRVETAEATERQRQQAALEQQRLQQEMELRRAEVAKKRPTWMLAVTGIAIVGVVIAIVLAMKFLGESSADREARLAAEERSREAEKMAQAAEDKVVELQRDLGDLSARVDKAVDAVVAARSEAERVAAQDALNKARKAKFEMEQRIQAAKDAAAKAKRLKGANVSDECKNNPLAKGCM